MAILFFIIILGLLVFVHELGHFLSARAAGVAVEEFGFGFPPRMIGIKRGRTILSINWIPFGGFVRLQGEQEDTEQRPDSFVRARFSRQLVIMVAGVVMNILLAWVLMTMTLVIGTKTDASMTPHDRFAVASPARLEAIVTDGTAASDAGLRNGDRVLDINGVAYTSTEDIIQATKDQQYPTLNVRVERNNTPIIISIAPRTASDHPRYGFGVQSLLVVRYPWYIAPWYGFTSVIDLISQTAVGFGHLIRDLVVTAKVSPDLTGPVGIAVLTGQVVQYGFVATLQFMAILSVSLAVVNILPLPALDGGRALFVTIGHFRGRPVNTRIEGTIHTIGFYMLLLVILLISIRDVSRFRLLEQLRSLFQ